MDKAVTYHDEEVDGHRTITMRYFRGTFEDGRWVALREMIPGEDGQNSMRNVNEVNTFTLTIPPKKFWFLQVSDAPGQFICNIEVAFRDITSGKPTPKPLRLSDLRTWILHCESGHRLLDFKEDDFLDSSTPDFPRDKKNQPSEDLTPIDVTLIDVERKCLVRTSTQKRYVALSYVWGGASGLQLKISNRSSLEAPGALQKELDDIPPLIRDVIYLVKSMGERYLWVDCLCIEKYSSLQKHFNISQMHIIYGHAIATLSILSGRSANYPLPGINSERHKYCAYCDFKWVRTERSYTARLTAFSAGFDTIFKESTYESRAWTFQERILSKRCIFIADSMATFSCHHGKLFSDQDDCLIPDHRLYGMKLMSIDPHINPLAHAINNGVYNAEIKAEEYLHAYIILVHQYTTRHLSFETDRLNGILEGLLKDLGGCSVAGLLETMLDYCLLWTHASRDGARLPFDVRNSYFPSWAWAGWTGNKSYYYGPLYIERNYRFGNMDPHLLDIKYLTNLWPENNLSSKLEDVKISYETRPRSLTRMPFDRYQNGFIGPISFHGKSLDFEVLHITAETASLSEFSIVSVEKGVDAIRLRGKDRFCGILYDFTFQDSGLVDDERIDIVLLSTMRCFLHSSYSSIRETWRIYLPNDFCQECNCSLGHVMLVKWQGHRAERVGLATLQMGAWQLVQRSKRLIQLV